MERVHAGAPSRSACATISGPSTTHTVCFKNGPVSIVKCDPNRNGNASGKSSPAVALVSSTEAAANSTLPPSMPVTTAEAVAVGVSPMSSAAQASWRLKGSNAAQAASPIPQFAASR